MLVIAFLLIWAGRPDKTGLHPGFLRFNAAMVARRSSSHFHDGRGGGNRLALEVRPAPCADILRSNRCLQSLYLRVRGGCYIAVNA
jgi:hypothetical protein